MLKLTFYNLSVELQTDDYILIAHIKSFLLKHYTQRQQKGFSQNSAGDDKVFAGGIKDKPIFMFHANQFIHLSHYLEDLHYKLVPTEKIDRREYNIVPGDFTVRSQWELRDYQIPVVEFLLDNPIKSKLVPIQTGKGKTFTALYTIGQINHRLGIVILPTYIEKWVSDIATIHDAKQTDVMVIQGSKALAAIIEMAKTDSLENNYYIFSSRTMQEYINQYEEDPQLCIDMYGCAPIELFPLLGIGVMLVDETHQHYHAIFKILIYTNVKFQIGLSATLMSDDNLVARMHKVVYPNKCVYSGGELDRYTDVYAVSYTIPETYIRHIKTKNYGSNNYSHTAFEQSIIRNNDLLKRYIRMIKANVDDYYIDDYQDRDKIIVFVSTVALATRLSDAFRSFYPEFKIRRYCEEDSYEDMLGGDIIVSTPISAGTALDIPRLRVAINTVSISSAPTNIQILGRLRKLPDRDVKYVYIYAQNINKQREYHFKRMELFKPRVANIALRQSSAGL